MDHRELALYWLILLFEVLLCFLVYSRGLHRRLPFFGVYVTVLLLCSLELGATYYYFGFRSAFSYYSFWATIDIDLVARCLAIAELCYYKLRVYRGIWELCWRLLGFLAAVFLAHAAVDAWGQLDRVAIYTVTLERDVDITCIVILLTLLLIRNYYGLALDPLQKWVAVGIFLLCLVDVINNKALQHAFAGYLAPWFHDRQVSLWSTLRSEVDLASEWWNTIRFSAFIVSMSIWCYALRKPLPAAAQEPALLPAEVYGSISPAVNLRLRAFNDRLLELLKT